MTNSISLELFLKAKKKKKHPFVTPDEKCVVRPDNCIQAISQQLRKCFRQLFLFATYDCEFKYYHCTKHMFYYEAKKHVFISQKAFNDVDTRTIKIPKHSRILRLITFKGSYLINISRPSRLIYSPYFVIHPKIFCHIPDQNVSPHHLTICPSFLLCVVW